MVLIAAPVFCWGFPAQIKGLIDRMFCMMDFDGERPGVRRLQNRRMALLLTGGGEETDNADLVIRGFRQLVEYLGGRLVGHLYVGGCTTPKKITDDVKVRAFEFAAVVSG
jgi:putative NADPH-quinone reductase